MKIIAQDGFGPKDKLTRGVNGKVLDGAILSPRYRKRQRMRAMVNELLATGCVLALDPEFYATEYISRPTPNLGALEEWPYFKRPRRSSMISGAAIDSVIKNALSAQHDLRLERLIGPNIYIRQADSIDTAIALNFLNKTKSESSKLSDKPVYGTLAIHRDALLAGQEFRDALDSLTGMENPPDGYYIIVGSGELQSVGKYVRSDLSQAEVVAGWMYANHVLSINGADVINGYCFLLGPLLGVCGAGGAASGWSSGLRKFCIDRYTQQQGGGRAPNVRYVSNRLLSHVRQTDLDTFRPIDPNVMNELDSDRPYDGEPTRTEEALQAWEALRVASKQAEAAGDNLPAALCAYQCRIRDAIKMWQTLQSQGLHSEIEPNLERLDAMVRGIDLFMQWAELAPSPDAPI